MIHPSETLESIRGLMSWREGEGCTDVDAPLASFMDSFCIIQLVTILEDRFDVRFEQEDMVDEAAWVSARRIAELVDRVRARA